MRKGAVCPTHTVHDERRLDADTGKAAGPLPDRDAPWDLHYCDIHLDSRDQSEPKQPTQHADHDLAGTDHHDSRAGGWMVLRGESTRGCVDAAKSGQKVRRVFLRILAIISLAAPALQAQEITPPPDPTAEAPEALATARASLRPTSKKGGIKSADAYAAIQILKQTAEAYAAKGDTHQSTLYYQETLRSLKALAKAAPSFQPEEVSKQIQEIEAIMATAPAANPAEKTLSVELTRCFLQDGHLKVEWKLHPPDMTANEIERHLNFTMSIKLKDGSTVKKVKTVESLFLPSTTEGDNTYTASQDYLCPANVQSVMLGVQFFDVSVFQQNQVLP